MRLRIVLRLIKGYDFPLRAHLEIQQNLANRPQSITIFSGCAFYSSYIAAFVI